MRFPVGPATAVVSFVTGPAGFEVRWPDGATARAGNLAEAMATAYARLPLPEGLGRANRTEPN